MKKTVVLDTLTSFDDEKLIERLLFIEKVEKGLKDIEDGKVLNFIDAKQKFINK